MTSRVRFGWKPTTTAIFVGIRHVGVNAPHHFSQKPPLNFGRRRWRIVSRRVKEPLPTASSLLTHPIPRTLTDIFLTCKIREENNGMDIIVSAMIDEGYHSNYALKE